MKCKSEINETMLKELNAKTKILYLIFLILGLVINVYNHQPKNTPINVKPKIGIINLKSIKSFDLNSPIFIPIFPKKWRKQ